MVGLLTMANVEKKKKFWESEASHNLRIEVLCYLNEAVLCCRGTGSKPFPLS